MINERIRELEQQARFAVQDENGKAPYDKWRDKFAELIVRECAYVSEGYFGFKDHTPGTAIANEIKEHFGVGK